MTQEEYEAKLAELQTQIDELKKAKIKEEPTPPHPRWKPGTDEPYYTINCAYARAGMNKWDSDRDDGGFYSLGIVFQSESEAEFAVERLKVLAEMREWAGEWNDEYVIRYNSEVDHITSGQTLGRVSYGEMRFATEKDAENCIKAVGADRIKKYYFGVPDDDEE